MLAQERVAAGLLDAWGQLREELGFALHAPGTCVQATRVGVAALGLLGVDAVPLTVGLSVPWRPTELGHLVVHLPPARLVDLSVDQVSEPERGGHVEPLQVVIPAAFWSGQPLAAGPATYRYRPPSELWLAMQGWAGPGGAPAVVVLAERLAGVTRASLVSMDVTMTPRDEPNRTANATAPDRT